MIRVAVVLQVSLLILVAVLFIGQSAVHSGTISDRQEIVYQMLQAGSQGAGDQVTTLAARASKIPKVPQPDQKNQTQSRQCNEKGLEHVRSGDFRNAASEFEKAFTLNPADIEIANNLGFVHSKLGKYEEAKKDLLYTLALAPSRVDAWFNLGEVLAHQDDRTMATGAFYNAIFFSPKKQVTIASIQTKTHSGPPALSDSYQRVVKMVEFSPASGAAQKASMDPSAGEKFSKSISEGEKGRTAEPSILAFGKIPFGQPSSKVLKNFEGAQVKREDGVEFEVADYASIANDLREGIYTTTMGIMSNLHSKVAIKYRVSNKGWSDIDYVNLYFLRANQGADDQLFLVEKKLQVTSASVNFEAASETISRILGVESATTNTRFTHIGYERSSYSARVAKWTNDSIIVYYALAKLVLVYENPMILYIDRQGWKQYLFMAQSVQNGKKQEASKSIERSF